MFGLIVKRNLKKSEYVRAEVLHIIIITSSNTKGE